VSVQCCSVSRYCKLHRISRQMSASFVIVMQISQLHNTFAVRGWHGYFLLGRVLNATGMMLSKTFPLYLPMHFLHAWYPHSLNLYQSISIYYVSRERERATRFVARWRARQRRARGRWVDGQCARIVLFDDIMWMWVKDAETWIVSQPEEPNPSPSLFCSSNLAWLDSSK